MTAFSPSYVLHKGHTLDSLEPRGVDWSYNTRPLLHIYRLNTYVTTTYEQDCHAPGG